MVLHRREDFLLHQFFVIEAHSYSIIQEILPFLDFTPCILPCVSFTVSAPHVPSQLPYLAIILLEIKAKLEGIFGTRYSAED